MQIICKDGTTIQCADFKAIDSGVLFFQEDMARAGESEEESEADESDEGADGFVPITELHFVLPDEMVQQAPQPTGVPEQGRAGGAGHGAPTQQSGHTQQQQTQQFPRGPGQSGR
ncbi:hypothetical protein [Haloarcula laminariae]|uniref:hypothetical protein n=1 Tax=Haloarcula laminariae TaxID=2961577 RepID=UPI0021C93BC3|nr:MULTISPECIES: hypothetical protein [Halomicroarcula]